MHRSLRWSALCVLTLASVSVHMNYGLPNCGHNPEENAESIICQLTLHEECSNLGYNVTSVPNIYNHTSQMQAVRFLDSLRPDYSCSQYLIHFLCATAFPLCAQDLFKRVSPCREMCVAVRESCGEVMEQLGINCNTFEQFALSTIPCIWNSSDCMTGGDKTTDGTSSENGGSSGKRGRTNCTGHLAPLTNSTPRRDASFAGVSDCTESCQGVFFTRGEQNLLVIWITAWSLVTLFVSAVMFLTYVLNFKNIPSLEAPIYYIALCCALSALCYTLSVAIGSTALICDNEFTNQFNESAIVVNSLGNPLCASLFCLLYYFTLCTWSWWAVLCFQWLLCSLKFANVSSRWNPCFHIVAWLPPLAFVICAIALNHVNGDPIMHTCWIKKHLELPYLIAPLSLCLVLASVIIIVCFAKVVRLQRYSSRRKTNNPYDQMDHKTLVRVGLYCTVYVLPMGVLLCVYFYEYWFREQWEIDYLQCSVLRLSNCLNRTEPLLPLFLAKVTASLLMGVVSVGWMIKSSTAEAWKKVCCFCLITGRTDSNTTLGTPDSQQQLQCHRFTSRQEAQVTLSTISHTLNSDSPL